MMPGAYDRPILLVLSALGRLDVDVRLVEAYIAIGGKTLSTVTAGELRSLVSQAVQAIDLDPAETRREVLHTLGKPRKGDPTL